MDEQIEEMLAQLGEADIIITGKVKDVFAYLRRLEAMVSKTPAGLLQARWN